MIASVDIAGPSVTFVWRTPSCKRRRGCGARRKDDFGKTRSRGERKISLEYISANPPITPAWSWPLVLWAMPRRVMRHAGYDVFEEFYINDAAARRWTTSAGTGGRALPAAAGSARQGDAGRAMQALT